MSTQPSRLFDLWRRMYTRFRIEPLPAQDTDPPGVLTTIIPVTDADALVTIQVANTVQLDLDVTDGIFVSAFTVPAGKRWRIRYARRSATTANSRARGIFTPSQVTVFLSVLGTSDEVLDHLKDFIMEQGDQIGLEGTDDVGDGSINITVVVDEMDAFL